MSTSREHTAEVDGWTIVVPVKALDGAKSRLTPAVAAGDRRELVVAMATDVVRACICASGVTRVRVVSPDPEVRALAHRLGAEFIDEPTRPPGDGSRTGSDPLNAALVRAIRDVDGPVGVVTADLPELTSGHLGRILTAAAPHRHSFVADHDGTGTTMAFWTGPADGRTPRFGANSAENHRTGGGAVPLNGEGSPGAATRDIDTPLDLAGLEGRPVGEATSAAIRGGSTAPGTPTAGVSATMVP